jgi:hypothetical protein
MRVISHYNQFGSKRVEFVIGDLYVAMFASTKQYFGIDHVQGVKLITRVQIGHFCICFFFSRVVINSFLSLFFSHFLIIIYTRSDCEDEDGC